jgi:hypothetical protein
MLTHLRAEYGTMSPEELERNRSALSDPWNFDHPIEDLWAKITNIQRVASLGHVPIPDITIITLPLAMIEKTGLLASTTEKFWLRPIVEIFAVFLLSRPFKGHPPLFGSLVCLVYYHLHLLFSFDKFAKVPKLLFHVLPKNAIIFLMHTHCLLDELGVAVDVVQVCIKIMDVPQTVASQFQGVGTVA